MSYIEKCTEKKDLLFNKLKPSRNLIVFIVSENVYVAYTLNEMKEIMTPIHNHYVEDINLERFFYLPNGIRIDSSLSICFNNNVNTMKLVKSENKFYTGFETNKQYYSYYSVEAVLRQTIDSEEESTFDTEYTDKTNSDSEVEIDTVELEKQRDERKAKEKLQIERKLNEERKTGNYTEIKNYENGVRCELIYENKITVRETWFKNELKHREDDLPAQIVYKNGREKERHWWIDNQRHRTNGKPAYIKFDEKQRREEECWWKYGQRYRSNNLPVCVEYYENGNKKCEEWFVNNKLHRDNFLPACIFYNENGSVKSTDFWFNGSICN